MSVDPSEDVLTLKAQISSLQAELSKRPTNEDLARAVEAAKMVATLQDPGGAPVGQSPSTQESKSLVRDAQGAGETAQDTTPAPPARVVYAAEHEDGRVTFATSREYFDNPIGFYRCIGSFALSITPVAEGGAS